MGRRQASCAPRSLRRSDGLPNNSMQRTADRTDFMRRQSLRAAGDAWSLGVEAALAEE